MGRRIHVGGKKEGGGSRHRKGAGIGRGQGKQGSRDRIS